MNGVFRLHPPRGRLQQKCPAIERDRAVELVERDRVKGALPARSSFPPACLPRRSIGNVGRRRSDGAVPHWRSEMTGKVSGMLKALIEIRDEQRRVREAQQQTNERIDALERTVATELRSVGAVLIDVRDLLRDRLDVRDQVHDHEHRIAALERRPAR